VLVSRANVKDKRKIQLITAALDCIAKRGLLETTITHISKGAGMSRGIVNFYFNSKEIMLREALKTLIDDYEDCWRGAIAEAGDDGLARLQALINAHFSKKLCSAKRLNIMTAFWGHAATQAAYRNQLEAADNNIETAFTQALAHVYGGDVDESAQHARQLHALIRGLWLNFMLNPQRAERADLAAQALAFLDRLAGAPVRVMRGNSSPKDKPVKPAKAKKDQLPGQMDIEDLFGKIG
jgi:TetR/AcrR family transcriptional repressor of bet genes